MEESLPLAENNQLELYWESTYAVAMALIEMYPNTNPEEVGLSQMTDMILSLPGFSDDPSMVTERILLDIQIVWFEEASTL
ncbi:MAG: Fe-S assembly protein IscX [Chloroflexi bacterium]|nr:MAG: Fe-S assembly protein IscX [Chloroflexota bacterium]